MNEIDFQAALHDLTEAKAGVKKARMEYQTVLVQVLHAMRHMSIQEAYKHNLIRLNFTTEALPRQAIEQILGE